MKKYLLTALLWVFGLFWFTSAVNVSCIEDWTCEPSNIYNFSDNDNSYIFNISCSADLVLEDDTEYNLTDWQIITLPGWTTAEFVWVEDCDFSYELYYSSSSDWDSSDSSWLLPWWTWTFWWIISSLGSAVSEFIPYVAYIWLWLLGAIIWFVAIKRLINRVRSKIFWTFSWWRRR